MVCADFDLDGAEDIACANLGANTVTRLLGNGRGRFASRVDYPVGVQPMGIAAGDLDGDGAADLVVANRSANTLGVLMNTGSNGTFEPEVASACRTGRRRRPSPTSTAMASST